MAVTGALVMQGVGGLLSSFAGARAAKSQAALQIAQWRESEVLRAKDWANQSWFQTLEESEKWARNQSIGEEALRIREKNRYWQRERTNNTMSQMSNGMFKAYGDLQSQLGGRLGSNSATSKAMMRNAMNNYHKARDTINVNSALEKGLIDDQYKKTLAMRDFGFTKISEITPGRYFGQSPGQAYSSALMSGIGQTVMSVAGSHYSAKAKTG